VVKLLGLTQRELAMLPVPSTDDPTAEIIHRVGAFCTRLKGAVDGDNDVRGLVQANRKHYARFCDEIRKTAPDFRPFEQPESHGRLIFREDGDSDVAGMLPPLGVLQVKESLKSKTWRGRPPAPKTDEGVV